MVILQREIIGQFKGQNVDKFTWRAENGMAVSAISYGTIITAVEVPDKNNKVEDVALGFDKLDEYVTKNNEPYLGSILGRCANRISGGKFSIDGVQYKLTENRPGVQLHGGIIGFHRVNWTSSTVGPKVTFSYLSKDGEEGYPGDVLTNVTYELTDDGVFHIDFLATSTKKTVVNLSNHSYFNLAGHGTGAQTLYEHEVVINSDTITEVDENTVPTGKLLPVGGTPFDLRVAKSLGGLIDGKPELYDQNFCVSTYEKGRLNFVSRVVHPPSGRYLEVYSDQPGVQFYTSSFLPKTPNTLVGKSGASYLYRGAFCLETQQFPNSVNIDHFPNVILNPGETYQHKAEYRFGVVKN